MHQMLTGSLPQTIAVATTRDRDGTHHRGYYIPAELPRLEADLHADLGAGKDVTLSPIPPDERRGFPWWSAKLPDPRSMVASTDHIAVYASNVANEGWADTWYWARHHLSMGGEVTVAVKGRNPWDR